MKQVIARVILGSALVFGLVAVCVAQSEKPLTNASVTKLVRAGFKEKTVIAIIQSRPNVFQLEPERLIELKRNGVSETIILAMLGSQVSGPINDDEWVEDNSFFKGGPGQQKNDPQPGSVDIFGSGGESKSERRGRGMSGSGSGSTMTTGSATVRILRPPAEAGGQPLKLEKTPTLNNESIIELVDAGFSEGTIIKRIENSPADFDLSPAKLEALRKRRVSETVIGAMTAAMSDSTPTSSFGPDKE
jgi:hypothetical protein